MASSSPVDLLNDKFGLPDTLTFEAGPGGFIVARIETPDAFARVALHGAQLLSFEPRRGGEILWLSRRSYYTRDKAIRGGIPISWPWFASDPLYAGKPAHGFARLSPWQPVRTRNLEDGSVEMSLRLVRNGAFREAWPYDAALSLHIRVGVSLDLALETVNTKSTPIRVGAALHTYFLVHDVRTIRVNGLENTPWIEAGDGAEHAAANAPIAFADETNRIYKAAPRTVIEDPGLSRRIHITPRGSNSTVVWNPWSERANTMPDIGADQFHEFVCVETANAFADVRTLEPGQSHTLGVGLSVESLAPYGAP